MQASARDPPNSRQSRVCVVMDHLGEMPAAAPPPKNTNVLYTANHSPTTTIGEFPYACQSTPPHSTGRDGLGWSGWAG